MSYGNSVFICKKWAVIWFIHEIQVTISSTALRSYDELGSVVWLGHYATSRKVMGSRPDEMNGFFSIYLILPAALDPGVHSASNRNEYQKQ
jgi:hypothetical protein